MSITKNRNNTKPVNSPFYSFFFSAFWKHGGQVGESPSSPLEISKTAKFEGHCWKRTKYSSSKSCLRANVTYFLCCNKRNRRRLHLGSMVLNIKSLVASVQRSLKQGLSWRTTPIVAHFPQSRNSQLWVQALTDPEISLRRTPSPL